jgi:hypothetical protein
MGHANERLIYGNDVASIDRRDLTRRVPVVQLPLSCNRGDWVELRS